MKTRRMMTFVGLAIAVALLATPATYAQFNAELGEGRRAAVETPVSPAHLDLAYFNAEVGNVPQTDAWEPSLRERAMDSHQGNFVEVSQIVEDDYVPEGQSVYVLQVVRRELPAQTAGLTLPLRGK